MKLRAFKPLHDGINELARSTLARCTSHGHSVVEVVADRHALRTSASAALTFSDSGQVRVDRGDLGLGLLAAAPQVRDD